MVEIKLADDHIVTIAATSFLGPDGKPISAKDFITRMFGELPELFSDEDDLRTQWSDPDTRKALLERLAEHSYDEAVLTVVKDAPSAQDSDLYDVLAHIAYSNSMRTREHRAEVGRRRIGDMYECVFRSIRPVIPITSGHLNRGIWPPLFSGCEA
jgi:type I restriction enzyme R subunit